MQYQRILVICGIKDGIVNSGPVTIIVNSKVNKEAIYPYIEKRRLAYVKNTHGHYDHIAANSDLKARYDTKLAVGRHDAAFSSTPA